MNRISHFTSYTLDRKDKSSFIILTMKGMDCNILRDKAESSQEHSGISQQFVFKQAKSAYSQSAEITVHTVSWQTTRPVIGPGRYIAICRII